MIKEEDHSLEDTMGVTAVEEDEIQNIQKSTSPLQNQNEGETRRNALSNNNFN